MAEKSSVARNEIKAKKIDFSSDQDVRWCPGCGDYAILAQLKKVLPELGIPREKIVFVSGIGCSSRFPYYVNSYGFHTIHGRAPTIATGVKLANPELSVWIITGDGDSLSIGGSHLIHLCRRNLDVNVIMFNNQIYGLTKGQYSPTSPLGKITKTTPYGSLDAPFNPISLVLSAGASFVARTIDRDTRHMAEIFRRAAAHKGCSFVEVYQNCNIFNDGIYRRLTEADTKLDNLLYLEDGKPLIYGKEKNKGIRLNSFYIEKVDLDENSNESNLVYHTENSENGVYPHLLAQMAEDEDLPTPVGVFRATEREMYDDMFHKQMKLVTQKKGRGDLKQLFLTGDTWKVE
jgi:2-oxoglutarate ferredoxin oxidoreductase subunit beta